MARQKILYGAGAMGKRAFEHYTKNDPDAVFCFADTYKGGTEYLGKLVLSFEEFMTVHTEYDVILSIFDLSDAAIALVNANVSYIIWEDDMAGVDGANAESAETAELFERLREIEPENKEPKIIYGARQLGELALEYYGEENVYAFADKNKGGSVFHNKSVLMPEELIDLENKQDIVMCIANTEEASKSLISMGLRRFRIWNACDDVRLIDLAQNIGEIFNNEKVNELSRLDFIANPEYINDYRNLYIKHTRRSLGSRSRETSFPFMSFTENRHYGIYNEIAKYAGKSAGVFEGPAVSHGTWMNGEIDFILETQNVMNAGTIMKMPVHKKNRDCLYFTCGSYMHYAEPFYSAEEFTKYKKRLGRNLLVFPSHSISLFKIHFDDEEFVEYAVSEAKSFDSLSVCVYYSDYYNDTTQLFRSRGANIVTCGLHFDPSFVRRIKTIISASDAVLTNGLGSHIFYSLGMGKPIKFFNQKLDIYTLIDPNDVRMAIYTKDELIKSRLPTEEYRIDKGLLDDFEDICAFSQIKTKEEMGAIFDLSKRILEGCDYKRSRYTDGLRRTYCELRNATSNEEKLQFRLMSEALPPYYYDYISQDK